MILNVYEKLLNVYGKQGWWPLSKKEFCPKYHKGNPENEKDKFEICVGAILTQNTNWKNVEKSLFNLNKNSLIDKEKIKSMDIQYLAEVIKPSGYYNQKAKKLKIFASYEGDIERNKLLELWGLGPETVDSILLYAYDKPYFVVDAYTKRIFSRLGLMDEKKSYEEFQKMFHDELNKDVELFKEFHALIVEHAKKCCKKKPVCDNCVLKNSCKFI